MGLWPKVNLVNLCDDMILGSPCVLPMLEYVNDLLIFTHAKAIKIC